MKTILRGLAAGLLAGGTLAGAASAMPTLQWVNESGDGLMSVGGYAITQYNDASNTGETLAPSFTAGDWTVTGNEYAHGGPQLWLLDGVSTASTTFSVASTGVSFMMTGDHNDGFADFIVDGVTVLANFNLLNLGEMSLVVTGLANTTHTIAERHLDIFGSTPSQICLDWIAMQQRPDFACPDHVAIWGGAALDAPVDVPAPATLGLVGLGLAGLGVAARRRTR
jgi:hypothetical protein